MGIPITHRLKEIKKRRALRGKQRVELLMNSAGKRTVVLLLPSFFYFFNPFFVISHFNAMNKRCWLIERMKNKSILFMLIVGMMGCRKDVQIPQDNFVAGDLII